MNTRHLRVQALRAQKDYQDHAGRCAACAAANQNPATPEEAKLADRPVVRRCLDGVRLLVAYAAHVRRYSEATRSA